MQCRIVLCNCTIVHQFARKDQVTLVNEIYLRCSHQCSRQFIAKWGWVVSWMYFAVEHLQCDRMTSQQQGRNPPPLLPFLLIHRFFLHSDFRFTLSLHCWALFKDQSIPLSVHLFTHLPILPVLLPINSYFTPPANVPQRDNIVSFLHSSVFHVHIYVYTRLR